MGRFEISSRKPSPFEVAVNRAVRRTDTLSRSKRDQPKAARYQEGRSAHRRESREGGFASKVAKLWQVIHFVGHFWRRIIACKSVPRLDLHPAGLEPATLEVTELIQNRLGQRRSCERSSR